MWIENKIFNKAFLAMLMYGKKSQSNTAKLHLKIRGMRKWQEWELKKMEAIKKDIVKLL